ncbi:MAG: TonB-dependent siderophore receptor [Proteobacteria bacterium]|nr:TonB-dependent siderophore receptor [Pseudomonadota bacterium]
MCSIALGQSVAQESGSAPRSTAGPGSAIPLQPSQAPQASQNATSSPPPASTSPAPSQTAAPDADVLPSITVQPAKASRAVAKREATGGDAAQAPTPAPAPPPIASAPVSTGGGTPAANAKGDIGYTATRTTTATKTDTPLRDVPQSVSVVTDQQIKDQSLQSIGDVARYVPGVQIHQGEGNRDQISIRGQNASTADFFVNGVRDDGQVFRDLYNTERVEVLKGPSALVFGRGGAGGIVNRVTKQADFTSVREATFEYGSFDHRRTQVDIGDAISPFVAYRLLGVYENSDTYRDHVGLDRWGVNPTLAFKLSDSTRLTLGYEHFEDNRTADRGIPSFKPAGATFALPSPTSASTFFGSPSQNFASSKVDRAWATVEHKTDFGLTVRNHTSWSFYDKMYQNAYPGGPLDMATGVVPLVAYNNITNRENLFNQTDFIYKIDAGWMRHTLLAGIEVGTQQSDNFRRNGQFDVPGSCVSTAVGNSLPNGTCYVPFTNPIVTSPIDFVRPQTRNHVDVDVRSVYVQDQMQLTKYIEIVAGVRNETFDLRYRNLLPPTAAAPAYLTHSDNLTSPRAGLIVKPFEMLSLYGTYSISYLPASGDQFSSVVATTANLDPEKYTNYELGLKWDIAKALAFTAATYEIDRENVRVAQPDGSFLQTGRSRVRGQELTLTGYLTKDWQVSAGWSHNEGVLTSSVTSGSLTLAAGTPLPILPRDTVSLWTRYQFTPTWGAGVGVVHHTEMFAALQPLSNLVELPSFTTVDAALYWQITPQLSAQLNVTNIFNEKYIVSADGNDNLTPGAPTSAILTLKTKF